MRHHGITTVGETAREAFSLMKSFVSAARIQFMMESSGQDVLEIPAAVCEHVAAQYEKHDKGRASAEWPAYLRQLDMLDPGIATGLAMPSALDGPDEPLSHAAHRPAAADARRWRDLADLRA